MKKLLLGVAAAAIALGLAGLQPVSAQSAGTTAGSNVGAGGPNGSGYSGGLDGNAKVGAGNSSGITGGAQVGAGANSSGQDVHGGATSTTGPGQTNSSGGLNCAPEDSGCRGKSGALSPSAGSNGRLTTGQ